MDAYDRLVIASASDATAKWYPLTWIVALRGRLPQGLTYGILLSVTIAEFIFIRRSAAGNFLNSYPFLSPDGYDWIYEGAYLWRLLANGINSAPSAFILRQPLFVVVGMIDFLLGSRGIAYAVTLAGSLFLSALFLDLTLGSLRVGRATRAWALAIFILTPFVFYRTYVLVDPLAIACMQGCVFFLLKYFNDRRRKHLIAATALMILGGMAQLYGIIPYLIGVALLLVQDLSARMKNAELLVTAIAGICIYFGAIGLYYEFIPHETTPPQFVYLEINPTMLRFYVNVWLYYLGPLLPVFVFCAFNSSLEKLFRRLGVLLIASICLTFAVLTFFYHVREAQFTTYYFGFVVILAAVMLDTALLHQDFSFGLRGPQQRRA